MFRALVCLLFAVAAPAQTFREYSIPTSSAVPEAITLGPDGNVWFLEKNANKIGRITPSGTITEFAIPTAKAQPFGGIVTGPDGALWFTEDEANKIGRISIFGTITEFTIPTANSFPSGIVKGPDGNLWFTEYTGNKIGKLTPSGVFTEFPIPTSAGGLVGIEPTATMQCLNCRREPSSSRTVRAAWKVARLRT